MKSPVLGLRTCIYKVSDLSAATQWYSQAFGVEPYFDQPFYVGFDIGGFELGLQPEEEPGKGRNIETYWGVNHLQEEVDRFRKLGASLVSGPENVGGEIEVATLTDPWDNLIGLICNPHFKLPQP